MRQGTFQWMKSVNKSLILNKIRTCAPISRAQIAKETKLTPPTVSSNVKSLIEEGMVIESELGESQGGRKPKMLLINNDGFYVIGIDIGTKRIKCVISDLSGNITTRIARELTFPITEEEFINYLKESVYLLLSSAKINTDKIIGIGIAMHGVVEIETGIALFAPNLGITNIPIKAELEAEFQLDVKVENDARAMALGESWFGNHGEVDNMLSVNIGRGVGAGIVFEGKLFHGDHDTAGEIGHMTIDINGEICECGNRGCFQTFVTGSAIAMQAEKMLKEHNIAMDKYSPLSGRKVYELAVAGNDKFTEVLDNTGRIIGIGLTNLIHIISPTKIVLGGGVTKAEEFILPSIRESIANRALSPQAKETKVVISELGEDASISGAIALVLEDIFEPN